MEGVTCTPGIGYVLGPFLFHNKSVYPTDRVTASI